MAKFKRCLIATAFAVGGVFCSFAEVLVSEGCDTASDYAGASAEGVALLGAYPKSYNASIGLKGGSTKWLGYGATPRVYSTTLPLPTCFAGAGLVSKGAACVGFRKDTNASDHRWAYLELASERLKAESGTTLYFRGLMNVDKGAAERLSKPTSDAIGNNNSYGLCFTTMPSTYSGDKGTPIGVANNLGFYLWKNKSGGLVVSVRVTDASKSTTTSKRLIDGLAAPTAGGVSSVNTILCYAEVKVGAGTDGKEVIRAGAVRVSDYNMDSVSWSEPFELELISNSAYPTHLAYVGDYGSNGYAVMDEFVVGTELSDIIVVSQAGAPMLSDGLMSGSCGTYSAGASLSKASALDAGAVAHDGVNPGVIFSAGAVAIEGDTPTPFSKSFSSSDLTANKTYGIYVYATNDVASISNSVGSVYTGVLTLTKVKDADEYKLVPGEVTVSRANADPYPLTVNYTLSSSAVGATEGKTWEVPTSVTIPAGATSATLTLRPKNDSTITEDIVVTLSVTNGFYESVAQTVDITIKNLVTPAGYNTWIATADGAASVASNWSAGHAPAAGDNVLFDGDFANAGCTWDVETADGPSATIAALKMTSTYTQTVIIPTTYTNVVGSAFETLTITGDAEILGGTLTTPANGAAEKYILNLNVGQKFELASGASLNVMGKGFSQGKCRAGSAVGAHAATPSQNYNHIYGNVYAPVNIGSGGINDNGAQSCGGGAIRLMVGGAAIIDGKVDAQSSTQSSTGNPERGVGAGGSIFITAASISGSGTVVASAFENNGTAYSESAGSGGRVALVATTGSVEIPYANMRCSGSKGKYGTGGGTIFVKNAADANGTLLIEDTKAYSVYGYSTHWPTLGRFAAIKSNETWTVDRLLFRGRGVLTIPAGATLSLPNGFASVENLTSVDSPVSGILYRGGTISVPVAAEHVLTGSWLFQAAEPFVFPAGNVTLAEKAAIGCFEMQEANNNVLKQPTCTVTVNGDMTVNSGCKLLGEGRGLRTTGTGYGGHHGGVGVGNLTKAFDSILNPSLPGESAGGGDGGVRNNASGAAITLTVSGTLMMNGTATVKSIQNSWDGARAAGGTLNIKAAKIAGSGTFCADGLTTGNTSVLSGAGGRIAIRLTDKDAKLDDTWLSKITANSAVNTGNSDKTKASAGTVYLQNGDEEEGAGTIIVRSTNNIDVPTPIPSLLKGGETDNLRKAKLRLTSYGRVQLADSLKMAALTMGANTKLDLNGKTLTVGGVALNGTKLAVGTYTASSAEVTGFVIDSGSGGQLVIRPGGLKLIIR